MRIIKNKLNFYCLVICLLFTGGLSAQNADVRLLKTINPDTITSQYWKQTSNSAYWLPAGLSLGQLGYGLISGDSYSKRCGVEMLITLGIGQLLSGGVKNIVKRPRPVQSWPTDIHPENYHPGTSFPSGHTTLAFSAATALSLTRKQWYITVPIYSWAGSVGYSRMYLGRHYPTDVLGGIVVGICSGLLGHWVTGKIYKD